MRKLLPQGCLIAVVLVLADGLLRTGSGQTISLSFSNEMILQDAVKGANFTVTDEFESAVSDAVNVAAGSSVPITTTVYSVPPHLVLLSNAWSTGTTADVESEIHSLGETFASWRETTGGSVYSSLNELCLSNIGRQPAVIDVTDSCSYYDDSVVPDALSACNRSLSLTFLSPQIASPNATRLREVLCSILDTDCGLITCSTTGSEAVTTYQATLSPNEVLTPIMTVYTVMTCSIQAENRNRALVTVVNYASSASALSSQQISYIRAGGIQVYYEGQEPRLTFVGTTSQCLPHYWYLIFLIILVPLILIVGQRIYLWGRRSGKKSIRDYEKDIRAGVHLSGNPWGAYGGAGGARLPPPGYGPPANYGGVQGGTLTYRQGGDGWPSARSGGRNYAGQQDQLEEYNQYDGRAVGSSNIPPQQAQQQFWSLQQS